MENPGWVDKLSWAKESCPLNPPKWGPVELAPSLGFSAWWKRRTWLNKLGRKITG